MHIDWFTVVAQALNFLVLVWLMKRVLYRPILQAIDNREKCIEVKLADASAKQVAADTQSEEFKRKNADFDQQRDKLFADAVASAGVERQRLMDVARLAAANADVQRLKILSDEALRLSDSITIWVRAQVVAVARKVLKDLVGMPVEELLIEVFIKHLRQLDTAAKLTFTDALKMASTSAVVRSAFILAAAQRKVLQQAFDETFLVSIPLQFDIAPELIGGIELTVNGHKLAWSIADYLTALDATFGELLAKNIPLPALTTQAVQPAAQTA